MDDQGYMESNDASGQPTDANGAPPSSRAYVTVEEAATILDLSISTIRRRVRDGSLPSLQLGGRGHLLRIPREAMMMLTLHEPEASTQPPEPAKQPVDATDQANRLPGPQPRWMTKQVEASHAKGT